MSLEQVGLYKSVDGGKSWRQIAAGLDPEAPIGSILYDPTDSSIVYLASAFSGVHVSTDGGGSWQPLNEGLTHRTANTLGISGDGTVLYVGIEGAGVYRLGDPPPVDGVADLLPIAQTESESDPEAPQPDAGEDGAMEPEPSQTGQDSGFTLCPASYLPALLALSLILSRRRSLDR